MMFCVGSVRVKIVLTLVGAVLSLVQSDAGAAGAGAAGAGAAVTSPFKSSTAEPHHMVWDGINLMVAYNRPSHRRACSSSSSRQSPILDNVSGHALPGRLLAVLGPSGSGKSSLLNVLAGQVPAEKDIRLEGKVFVGNTHLDDFDTQRYIAYVRQEQNFYPFLTVRETLLIKAGLRLDRHVSLEQKEEIVEGIMEKLGLSGCADTPVGDVRTPGISGGEKRRLSMGLQMIGLESPSIVFLDEPTSGLDSHQALQVMETIRDLCSEGHTVVVAIHQPRSSIYALFDDLVLLSEGRVMYHGSTSDVLPRLASLGHKCPRNFNPADFLVDLISPGEGDKNSAAKRSKAKVLDKLAQAAKEGWKAKSSLLFGGVKKNDKKYWWESVRVDESEVQKELHDLRSAQQQKKKRGRTRILDVVSIPPSVSTALERRGVVYKRRRRGSRWPTQFALLLRRSWKQATRDTFAAVARVALGFGLGGIFGSIFWKLSLSEGCIASRVSLFVNVAMNVAMFGCARALQTLSVESAVVSLERMDEGYSASAYLSSKILAELPADAVFPLIFGTTVYFMSGLNNPVGGVTKLAKFLGTLLVQSHASSALGLMVGCLSPSTEAANLIGPSVVVISLLLSGVHDNIPPFLAKLKAFSTVNWGVQGIVTNEMRGIKFVPDGKLLLNGWRLGTSRQVIPGEDVMSKMGFAGEGLGKPTKRLLQLSFGCHLVTLASLMAGVPRFQRLEAEAGSSSPPCPRVKSDGDDYDDG